MTYPVWAIFFISASMVSPFCAFVWLRERATTRMRKMARSDEPQNQSSPPPAQRRRLPYAFSSSKTGYFPLSGPFEGTPHQRSSTVA